jgi:signal transduction histidine kinase
MWTPHLQVPDMPPGKPEESLSHNLGMAEDALLDWLAAQSRRLARLSDARPLTIDVLLCGAILAVSFFTLDIDDWLGPQTIIIGVALCAPLLQRRRHPELAFCAVAVVAFIQWLSSTPQLGDITVLITLYCVAARAKSLHVAAAFLVVEAGAILATLRWIVVNPLEIWVGFTSLAVAAAGLGIAVRQRRQLIATLRERAARVERERDQQVQLAAVGERARIAREMHDIVSHNLTVMIALADGASFAMDSSPDQARPALEQVASTGRAALGEMRRLLGVLADEPQPGPLEPQPSLARLYELVGRVEAAGIPVQVEVEGDPRGVSEGVQLAVFRTAQEALTNTLKHAVEPTCAHLLLRCGATGIELEVTDDGRGLVPVGAPLPGAGRGLPGLRERAAAYHGRLEAGPRPEGGWRVRLAIGP